ncbi:MAG TPA: hypothetical protein VNJ02_06525 [Vicinamibacterales bacterium]|nr:hypothetical protein [Vicinamibacterales bacterium]
MSNHYYGVDEQYFTTAADFGFTKRSDEAFDRWDRRASTLVMRDAFTAAADPTMFPEQIREGLRRAARASSHEVGTGP